MQFWWKVLSYLCVGWHQLLQVLYVVTSYHSPVEIPHVSPLTIAVGLTSVSDTSPIGLTGLQWSDNHSNSTLPMVSGSNGSSSIDTHDLVASPLHGRRPE